MVFVLLFMACYVNSFAFYYCCHYLIIITKKLVIMNTLSILVILFILVLTGVIYYVHLMESLSTSENSKYMDLLNAYAHKCNEANQLRQEIDKLTEEIYNLKLKKNNQRHNLVRLKK